MPYELWNCEVACVGLLGPNFARRAATKSQYPRFFSLKQINLPILCLLRMCNVWMSFAVKKLSRPHGVGNSVDFSGIILSMAAQFIGTWSVHWGRHNQKAFAPQLVAYPGSSTATRPRLWESTSYIWLISDPRVLSWSLLYTIITPKTFEYHLLFDPLSLGLGSTTMSWNVESRTTFC